MSEDEVESQTVTVSGIDDSEQQLWEVHNPSLDRLYSIASSQTLDLVSARWQIVESWGDGLCWYSWRRSQQDGNYELQLLDISDHAFEKWTQQVWEATPRPLTSQTSFLSTDGTESSRTAISKTLVVFDVDGPGTFLGYETLEEVGGGFSAAVRSFPKHVDGGFCDRGIVVSDGDRLLLYWVDCSELGRELPNPEWVPLQPRCQGTHLIVLRKIQHGWKYPPSGVDVSKVQRSFDNVSRNSLDISQRDSRYSIQLGRMRTIQSLDQMTPKAIKIYEDSLRKFENP